MADGQAKAGALPAAIAPGSGVEHVEDFLAIGRRNTGTLIADCKTQVFIARRHLQLQAAIGRGKARGVLQYIDQRLLDQGGMHKQQRQTVRHLGGYLQRRQHHP
ncbi:hypothetical protein D3C77_591350 [compost metagenome]